MSRERTGTCEPGGTWPDGSPRFRFRLRLGDGTKTPRYDVPRGHDHTEARAYVARMQATEDLRGELLAAKRARAARRIVLGDASAGDAWFDEWERMRKARGLTSTSDNRLHFAGYIRPTLDGKHVGAWTADDMRALVAALDVKIGAGDISAKFASNVWGTATKMCTDACRSKVAALRVRDDNPAKLVEGPDRRDARAKQFLYPSEFVQLVSCEEIPLRWRRATAIAVYMFPRHGELRALARPSIDLTHKTVHIHEAFERRSRSVKSTKSGRARRFALEAELVPLLAAMFEQEGDEGLLIPIANRMASRLREWLIRAGLTRRELLDTKSKTTRALGWHDLRATGITWMAVRGDDPLKIMQRAGHEDFATTQIYIRTAEAVRDGFGEPFPPLPASLLAPHRLDRPTGPAGRKANRFGAGHGIRTRRGEGIAGETAGVERPTRDEWRESPPKADDAPAPLGQLVQSADALDAALARALDAATAAGRLDDVARIVEELRARRVAAAPNVVTLRRRGSRS